MTYGFSVRCVFHSHRRVVVVVVVHRCLRHLCFRFVFVLLQLELKAEAAAKAVTAEVEIEAAAAAAAQATPPVYSETNED